MSWDFETPEELRAAGYHYVYRRRCRGAKCGQEIEFLEKFNPRIDAWRQENERLKDRLDEAGFYRRTQTDKLKRQAEVIKAAAKLLKWWESWTEKHKGPTPAPYFETCNFLEALAKLEVTDAR